MKFKETVKPDELETSEKVESCKSLRDLQRYEARYRDIYWQNKKRFVKVTGCQLPCNFREFAVAYTERRGKGGNDLQIKFADDEIVVETEDYVYEWISFIAECGGALGLFLGFSFTMVLDMLLTSGKTCWKFTKKHLLIERFF